MWVGEAGMRESVAGGNPLMIITSSLIYTNIIREKLSKSE